MMKLVLALLGLLALIVIVDAGVCSNPSSWRGQVVCDQFGGQCGQCVSFYKKCSRDYRRTTEWRAGARVRGARLGFGTGIATFPSGSYRGHAAIYVGQDSTGIQVWDQWVGRPVAPRTIRWGGSSLSNNGDAFYVIN